MYYITNINIYSNLIFEYSIASNIYTLEVYKNKIQLFLFI